MNKETWSKIMELEPYHTTIVNSLDKNDVTTIVATAAYFGAEANDLRQIYFDLTLPKFRVFDWLAMGVMGRIECKPALKVLVYSFLKVNGGETAFIEDLRTTDYEIDTEWMGIVLDEEGGDK
jgi:hypothetical protein